MIRTMFEPSEIEQQQQQQQQQQQHRGSLDSTFVDLSAQMMFDVDRRHVEEITQHGNVHITVLE